MVNQCRTTKELKTSLPIVELSRDICGSTPCCNQWQRDTRCPDAAKGKEARCIQSAVEVIKNGIKALGGERGNSSTEAGGSDHAENSLESSEDAAKPATSKRTRGAEDSKDSPEESSQGQGKQSGKEEDTWVCDAGCNGVACVTIERKGIDPVAILEYLYPPSPFSLSIAELACSWEHVKKLSESHKEELHKFIRQHKFCYRFIPLQRFCRATMDDISSLTTAFLKLELEKMESTSFSIAKEIPEKHKVQLYKPEVVIVVQVIKSACGMSVVKDAARFLKSQSGN
ncbi:hypothetical protein GUITHDRAFT_108859 [Guillardia theta CCMP2712]|uniref:THUMP domain-containing protein n=1 Tax=Guillardia theta (strain CCMP2712) TaxID=905079 RepID=L1J9I8_GUITC|nr:hypothetical protein GUITHDRAFT_108859 [Guillardia theta CCMP2712]EKX45218.1 hypothetical protein GUITHDRAFT_108859 [Guillardia theta CCMP2712]|eukprot:XP_005832198.1 hypothetical protein GUITHDRAFT_108859 [Guillardia theta CCMP2712]